ncbi:MAG TPA: hypothetical protein VG370_06445 [Chloroflexota bacterium]|nr:hypothetical protein [Chloroflexota bacterium]
MTLRTRQADGRAASIPAAMQAVVLTGPGFENVTVQSVPSPRADRMELLCRVDSVFICGTDPRIIKGDYHRFPLSAFPDALATFVGRKDGAIKVLIKP